MAAGDPITDLSDLVNLMTGAGYPENLFCWISNRIAGATAPNSNSASFTSTWLFEKSIAGAGAIPSTAIALDNTVRGGFMQASNQIVGGKKRMISAAIHSTAACSFILYDRLTHQGGLDASSASLQTTNLPTAALTRYTDGIGNFIFVEVYAQIGATARDLTINYIDSNDDPQSAIISIGGSNYRDIGRFFIATAANDSLGVKSIESVQLSASTGTAGNFGVGIGHYLEPFNVGAAGVGANVDFISGFPSQPVVEDGACLSGAFLPTSTLTVQHFLNFNFVEK